MSRALQQSRVWCRHARAGHTTERCPTHLWRPAGQPASASWATAQPLTEPGPSGTRTRQPSTEHIHAAASTARTRVDSGHHRALATKAAAYSSSAAASAVASAIGTEDCCLQ